MEIEAQALEGDITRIRLSGRMDIQGVQQIDVKLAGHTAVNDGRFVIDLSAVDFLASIGIRSLVSTAKAVQKRGGKLVLLGPGEGVSRVLSMAGIDTIIPVCADLTSARDALT